MTQEQVERAELTMRVHGGNAIVEIVKARGGKFHLRTVNRITEIERLYTSFDEIVANMRSWGYCY